VTAGFFFQKVPLSLFFELPSSLFFFGGVYKDTSLLNHHDFSLSCSPQDHQIREPPNWDATPSITFIKTVTSVVNFIIGKRNQFAIQFGPEIFLRKLQTNFENKFYFGNLTGLYCTEIFIDRWCGESTTESTSKFQNHNSPEVAKFMDRPGLFSIPPTFRTLTPQFSLLRIITTYFPTGWDKLPCQFYCNCVFDS